MLAILVIVGFFLVFFMGRTTRFSRKFDFLLVYTLRTTRLTYFAMKNFISPHFH